MSEKLTARQVANELDISIPTLLRWYAWYYGSKVSDIPSDCPVLPIIEREGTGRNAKRVWKKSDIPTLKVFKSWVPRGRGGVMGELDRSRKSKKP
jgi:hypothetical protein